MKIIWFGLLLILISKLHNMRFWMHKRQRNIIVNGQGCKATPPYVAFNDTERPI